MGKRINQAKFKRAKTVDELLADGVRAKFEAIPEHVKTETLVALAGKDAMVMHVLDGYQCSVRTLSLMVANLAALIETGQADKDSEICKSTLAMVAEVMEHAAMHAQENEVIRQTVERLCEPALTTFNTYGESMLAEQPEDSAPVTPEASGMASEFLSKLRSGLQGE